jgi:hypothetical protein
VSTIRDAASNRDKMMWRHFANEADSLCDKLEGWMQSEIKALMSNLQVIEATGPSQLILARINAHQATLRDLQSKRIPDVTNICKARIEEVYEGFYEDPFDACDYLREATKMLETMARDLCNLRYQLDGMMEPSDDVPDEPSMNKGDDAT